MPQPGKPQQKPEPQCPMCGSPLAKSPAGQQVLQRVSQGMAQKAQGGPQARPQGPGMSAPMQRPGMPAQRPMGPQGR